LLPNFGREYSTSVLLALPAIYKEPAPRTASPPISRKSLSPSSSPSCTKRANHGNKTKGFF
jgi:hypothetical protein